MQNPSRATTLVARSLSLLVAIVLTASLGWSGIRPDDDKGAADAVRQQLARYTAALDAADVDLAAQVWQTSADISFIHPAGHAHGWEEVKGFYRFFGSSFSERKLTVRDVAIHVHGEAAWVEFYWHFAGKRRNDGSVVETDGRETQIYNKTGERWQLVHVHYSEPTRMQ